MNNRIQSKFLAAFLSIVLVTTVFLTTRALPQPADQRAPAAYAAERTRNGRVIPTTSNPTGNGSTASRTYANSSFEQSDFQCIALGSGWAAIGMDKMRGWYSSHSPATETNCPGYVRSGQRVIELQKAGLNAGNAPYDGLLFAELSAFERMYIYQPLCMQSGEQIDFKFHHKPLTANRSDIMVLRFGVPSGLPVGAVAADTYNRPVMYAKTTSGSNRWATAAAYTGFSFSGTNYTTPADTTSPAGAVTAVNGWAEYSGTHTLPATGWDGIYNLGFYGIDSDSPDGGNLLDGIEIALSAMVDLGSSRDTSANEQATPPAMKIRINGRVPAGAQIALKTIDGDATPDADYSIGTVSAGAFGTATVSHTSGTGVWLITVPAGDYDGGVVVSNNKGGLTIPITYSYDMVTEAAEYVHFAIADPGTEGSSTDWAKGDPTCDTSEKNDGVVYTITNVDPTATPTFTPTRTNTPTATPTPSGQTITFTAPTGITTASAPFDAGATASSGLAVTYEGTTPSVCTVTPTGTITVLGPGTCTVVAHQIGGVNGGITYTAAPDVTRSFIIPAAQTITFPPISDKSYIVPDFDPGASASSTLPVSYSSSTPAICMITGGKIHLLAIGTCTVTAAQPGGVSGGVTYAAASSVSRTFNVLGAPQVITAPPVPQKHTYDGPFDLAAVSDSGLPVEYESQNPAICTVSGKKVTIVGPGTCYVKAKQPGAEKDGVIYRAAADVVFPINITDATATSTPTATRTATPTPNPIAIKKAAVGASFVLGLLYNGTLVTWGMNKEYQTNIAPCCANNITDVSVGTNFAVALKGGRVYGWGANTRGQLNIPMQAQKDVVAISSGYAHTLALKMNGTLVCWGNNDAKQCNIPKSATGVLQAVGGQDFSLALLKSGKVIGWGSNAQGQIKIPTGLANVKAITAGCTHAMALKKDGTVAAWGSNKYLEAKVPLNLNDVKEIGAGCNYSMALRHDGQLFGWGRNENNQITIPPGYTFVEHIGVGYVNSIITMRGGQVVAIGAPEHDALISRTPTKTPTPTP